MKLKDLFEVCTCSKSDINIYVFDNNERKYNVFKQGENEGTLDYFNRLSAIKDYEITHLKTICVASESNVVSGSIGVFAKLEVYVVEE